MEQLKIDCGFKRGETRSKLHGFNPATGENLEPVITLPAPKLIRPRNSLA
jgi:hypothetical protein